MASFVQGDTIAVAVLLLALVLVVARLGGAVARHWGQPPVLGELLGGVLLAALSLVGIGSVAALQTNPWLGMLAELGVILLLFEIGLESTVAQMMKVGLSSLGVATIGVVAPFALGWAVGVSLLPDAGLYVHAFLGATLSATSVGITARVLKDLRRANSDEARIILGAAVIDDVQGLVMLAVLSGSVAAANSGSTMSHAAVAVVLMKAAAFLVGSLVLGLYVSPKLMHLAIRLDSPTVGLAVALAFCFALSWLAAAVGLAPIVGAFAAGLVLEDVRPDPLAASEHATLVARVGPIVAFLAPVFFVLTGARIDLRAFMHPRVVALALALSLAAIVGKQVSGLGVIGRGYDRLSIGIGMVPRGEVGLIFANLGLTLTVYGRPLLEPAVFSAVVAMVIATTLITPPALKWSLGRAQSRR